MLTVVNRKRSRNGGILRAAVLTPVYSFCMSGLLNAKPASPLANRVMQCCSTASLDDMKRAAATVATCGVCGDAYLCSLS